MVIHEIINKFNCYLYTKRIDKYILLLVNVKKNSTYKIQSTFFEKFLKAQIWAFCPPIYATAFLSKIYIYNNFFRKKTNLKS